MESSIAGGLTLVAAAVVAGSVLIGASTAEDRRAPAIVACTGAAAIDFACHERRYARLVRRDGPRAALAALASEQRRNGYVRAACHQLTHRIGRAAGSLRGLAAFADGRSTCASGYYHGVLQSVMGKAGVRGSLRQAQAICAGMRTTGPRTADYYNCVHGMGHGFMEIFSSDVFKSLHGCSALEDRWEQDECSGGVFMENVTAIDNRGRPSRALRPAQPLYPCTEVSRRFWEQCYDWQITYALYVNDSDFHEVFGLCAARVAQARGACYRGLGGDVLQHSRFVTSQPARRATIARLCALGPGPAAQTACVAGAVRNLYRDYVDGDVQAAALCRSLERVPRAACVRAAATARRVQSLPLVGAR